MLKKKYKQLMQEKEAGRPADSDRPAQQQDSPPRLHNTVQREGGEPPQGLHPLTSDPAGRAEVTKAAPVSHQGPTITITECPDSEGPEEVRPLRSIFVHFRMRPVT